MLVRIWRPRRHFSELKNPLPPGEREENNGDLKRLCLGTHLGNAYNPGIKIIVKITIICMLCKDITRCSQGFIHNVRISKYQIPTLTPRSTHFCRNKLDRFLWSHVNHANWLCLSLLTREGHITSRSPSRVNHVIYSDPLQSLSVSSIGRCRNISFRTFHLEEEPKPSE